MKITSAFQTLNVRPGTMSRFYMLIVMYMGDQAPFTLLLRVHVRQFPEERKRLHYCFLETPKLR